MTLSHVPAMRYCKIITSILTMRVTKEPGFPGSFCSCAPGHALTDENPWSVSVSKQNRDVKQK